MLGQKLGDYVLTAELGAGGMGTVYLGEHDGQKVAIKVVHPHLIATPGFFKRFLREADLGRQVRHENVVRTFDVDATLVDDRQVNYLVMEYVAGRGLRDVLRGLGTVPETLLREIAAQMAAGLGAIHAAGIVHRDLKPENVLITDDDRVRIMDLGVAKLQEASVALTREGSFAGSLPYAAPEQFRRDEEIGPAADLYSLGVVLYELATGANPFRADDAGGVIAAHLNEEPPRAHERNDEMSLFLSEVVATLLAKSPADRFATAEELGEVLASAEASAWWSERAPALAETSARVPRVRVARDVRLRGRERELEALRAAWADACGGSGRIVFLEGEAGIGKTRLVDAFLREAADGTDAHLLYGAYPPSGGLGAVSDAILGKFGETGLEATLRPYLAATPSLLPAFVALTRREPAPAGAEPLRGEALQAVVTGLFGAIAEEQPAVWVVDDLHNAPPESQALTLAMARAVEERPALLVLAARPGVGVADFSRLDGFRRVDVGRLSPREVVRLLEEAFQSEMLADRLGAQVAVKSDGVPFFILEIVRSLKEAHAIEQGEDGSFTESQRITNIEVPSAVKDLIAQRMRDLTAEHRAVLDVGAVQGAEFDPDLVARVREAKRVKVLETLAEIERQTGIVRASGRRYRFDQNQIHEVVLEGVSEPLREEYHTMLAEAFAEREGTDGDVSGEHACFLAMHHLHGTTPRAALPFVETAADYLFGVHRLTAAVELVDRALDAPRLVAGLPRGRLLLHKARMLQPLGHVAPEREALEQAERIAVAGDDAGFRARVARVFAYHFFLQSQYDEAHPRMVAALELARTAGEREIECWLLGDLGGLCERMGRYDESVAYHEGSLAVAEELGLENEAARAIANKAVTIAQLGQQEEATHLFREALARTDSRMLQASFRGNLGSSLIDLGRHDEAAELLEQSVAGFRDVGFRQLEGHYTAAWGQVTMALGRYERAERLLERGIAIQREARALDGAARNLSSLAELRLALGRGAREAAEESLSLARSLDVRPALSIALRARGLAALADGDASGEQDVEEALALQRELERRREAVATLLHLARLRDDGPLFEEALEFADDLDMSEARIVARAHLARLGRAPAEAAEQELAERRGRLFVADEMEANFVLAGATGNTAHLAEAKRLLALLREHAPEDARETMIDNVPLHRAIADAGE